MKLAYPFPLETWDDDDPFGNHSAFRKSKGFGPHRGDDWMPGAGARIPASGAGRVVSVTWNGALGWVLVVEYNSLPGVFFGYCHLRDKPSLHAGTRFGFWDTLGIVGNTGSASFGAHLHLTASYTLGSPGWVPVINPMQFFGLNTNTAGGDKTPLNEESLEDDMKTTGIYFKRNSVDVFALINPGSGFYSEWSGVDGTYNNPLAVGFDTGSFVKVTESHARNLAASAAQVRTGK